MRKEYITIGTNKITVELFSNISRPFSTYMFKPFGGVWFTEYNKYKNEWLELVESSKNMKKSKLSKEACITTFDDEIRIASISKDEDIKRLANDYPNRIADYYYYYPPYLKDKYLIDYEALANDYDGIYVDLTNISKERKKCDKTYAGEMGFFDINSLIIFNSEHINDMEEAKITKTFGKSKIIRTGIHHSLEKPKESYFLLYVYLEEQFYDEINKRTKYLHSLDYINYIKELKSIGKELLKKIILHIPPLLKDFYREYKEKNVLFIIDTTMANILVEYIKKDNISNLDRSKRYTIGNF